MLIEKRECRELFGKKIYFHMIRTDEGIQMLIAGGDKSHVGSVTVISSDGVKETICFPGHKDNFISEKWAEKIYQKYHQPVVVTAGIHYDSIAREQIATILELSDDMLLLF